MKFELFNSRNIANPTALGAFRGTWAFLMMRGDDGGPALRVPGSPYLEVTWLAGCPNCNGRMFCPVRLRPGDPLTSVLYHPKVFGCRNQIGDPMTWEDQTLGCGFVDYEPIFECWEGEYEKVKASLAKFKR